jgi:transposase
VSKFGEPESVIYSDNWRGYNGLVDVVYGKRLGVDHGRNEFAKGKTHISGIEGFWGFAKARLARFRGMRKTTFYLHVKEYEFRFNSRGDNLYMTILKIVRMKPLF